MKATNTILLDDKVGGKGKYFKTRFLQAGLVKYSFGVCLLEKEVIDKFVYDFVGCPVIINHKDVTSDSAKDDRVGVISKIWYDEFDGWYWGEGVIFEQKALDLIDDGYNVSCQYEITEYSENREHKLHNGNEYDKTILNGRPEHLAIVENPRYENAMIAVNAIETIKADNGFITLDELDEDGNRKVIWIPGNVISKTVKDRIIEATKDYKEGDETKFDFSHTRVKPTEEQIKYLKDTLKEVTDNYKFKGVAQIEISSELNKGSLGVCYSPDNTSLISLSPQLYSGKYTQETYDKSKKSGWSPAGTGEMVKSVLVHELGHAITCNSKDEKFWNKIETVRSDYMKNIKKDDIKNPDWISKYARTNKYEFVAEAFCQGHLAKKYGKYTKQIMDLINEHFGKTTQMKLAINENKKTDNNDDMWIEEYGNGYPIDEETYNEWQKENKKEKSTAKNDIIQAINEIKESKMFKNLFKKEDKMDKEEMKSIFMECLTELTAKNEEEKKEEVKEEVKEKEEAENKCKNEEPDYKKMYEDLKAECEAKKEKAKNSVDEQMQVFCKDVKVEGSTYITEQKAIELGDKLF